MPEKRQKVARKLPESLEKVGHGDSMTESALSGADSVNIGGGVSSPFKYF